MIPSSKPFTVILLYPETLTSQPSKNTVVLDYNSIAHQKHHFTLSFSR